MKKQNIVTKTIKFIKGIDLKPFWNGLITAIITVTLMQLIFTIVFTNTDCKAQESRQVKK